MAGRQLQSLRDRTKDAARHFRDFEGKLDAAETEEQRLERQLEECKQKKSVCMEKCESGQTNGFREKKISILSRRRKDEGPAVRAHKRTMTNWRTAEYDDLANLFAQGDRDPSGQAICRAGIIWQTNTSTGLPNNEDRRGERARKHAMDQDPSQKGEHARQRPTLTAIKWW